MGECSGKGICDRSTGECECFDGYGGKGCQRMTCPNDCSGHGTCEYIEELTFGASSGAYFGRVVPDVAHTAEASVQSIVKSAKTFSDTADELWDFHKSMACTCDPGYIEVDCSRRMCPKANDVMDERLNIADAMKYQIQNITLCAAGNDGQGNSSEIHEFYGKSFALTFISTLNESFTTIPIDIGYDTSVTLTENNLADHITASLKGLPNKVITNVNVNTTLGYERRTVDANSGKIDAGSTDVAFLNIEVEFVGASTMGPQHLLTVEAEKCAIGCTPRIRASTSCRSTLSLLIRLSALSPRSRPPTTTTTSAAAAASATTTRASANASRASPARLARSRPHSYKVHFCRSCNLVRTCT